jgi:hypothetical protein
VEAGGIDPWSMDSGEEQRWSQAWSRDGCHVCWCNHKRGVGRVFAIETWC